MDIPMDSENMAPRPRFPTMPAKNGLAKGNQMLGQRKALCPVKADNDLLGKLSSKMESVPCKGDQEVMSKCHPNIGTVSVAANAQGSKGPSAQAGGKNNFFQPPSVGFSIFCDESFESPANEDLITDDDDDIKDNESNDHYDVVTAQDPSLKEILDTSNLVLPNLDSPVMCTDPPMVTSCQQNASPLAVSGPCEGGDQKLFSCIDYADTVLAYLIHFEKKFLVVPDYMSHQPEINNKMRTILIDWMVEVAEEYKLSDETVFLAVSYIDRYLSNTSIERSSFQLLGTSCLFIASKYEEIYPPEVNEFVFVTDDSYTKKQVIDMEMQILQNLEMNVSSPTAYYFLQKYLDDLMISSNVQNLAEFYCYLALLEGQQYLKFCPSEISLASVILAAHVFNEGEIINQPIISSVISLQSQSLGTDMYNVRERINECINYLKRSHNSSASSTQAAIHTRYSSSKHLSVAYKTPASVPQL